MLQSAGRLVAVSSKSALNLSRPALRNSGLAGKNFLRQQPNAAFAKFSQRSFSTVKVTFVDADGDSETVDANVGDSLLDVAFDHDIEIEGACGGEVACSTCHIILDQETFDSLPEAEEEEEDMLDLALGLTDTSRLGCQVKVTEAMDGIVIKLPAETSNMQG